MLSLWSVNKVLVLLCDNDQGARLIDSFVVSGKDALVFFSWLVQVEGLGTCFSSGFLSVPLFGSKNIFCERGSNAMG
jgi:hypothetical protein